MISGRGSNLQALIEACADPVYPAEIAVVISDRAQAPGLARAEAAGIHSMVISQRDRPVFAVEAGALLRARRVELVCLAGFMRLLDPDFVDSWRDRMVNIHPSLLPAFPGLRAQRQALAAGVRFSGCTVHFVRPEDDEARLSARILQIEHRLYPLSVRLIAEGRLRVVGDTVEIDGWQVPDIAVLNPSGAVSRPLVSSPG
jgi:phosphoribosylglycinamide formyltransferase 1